MNFETLFSQDFPFEILGNSSQRDNVVKRSLWLGATTREPLGENSTEKEKGRTAPCHQKTPGNSLRIPENQLPFNVREGDTTILKRIGMDNPKGKKPYPGRIKKLP